MEHIAYECSPPASERCRAGSQDNQQQGPLPRPSLWSAGQLAHTPGVAEGLQGMAPTAHLLQRLMVFSLQTRQTNKYDIKCCQEPSSNLKS